MPAPNRPIDRISRRLALRHLALAGAAGIGTGAVLFGDGGVSAATCDPCDPNCICTVGTWTPTPTSMPSPTATATATPTPIPTATPTPPPAVLPTLLATYRYVTYRKTPQAGFLGEPKWRGVKYLPRQFAVNAQIPELTAVVPSDPTYSPGAGPYQVGYAKVTNPGSYAGWDVFSGHNKTTHRSATTTNYLTIALRRAATVGIVWRGGALPAGHWLLTDGWTAGGTITANKRAVNSTTQQEQEYPQTYPVYTKAFPAGDAVLKAVNAGAGTGTKDVYWVLLAEADGTPSPAPAVPAGQTTPTPNALCPDWVHDAAKVGPANVYDGWHAAIDPVYWCYQPHEHGSNPETIMGFRYPLGEIATKAGMTENRHGYKWHVEIDQNQIAWVVLAHIGTHGTARVCQPHHEVAVFVKDLTTGEILAFVRFMAEYGHALSNVPRQEYTAAGCAAYLADIAATDPTFSRGFREIPLDDQPGYEPWTFNRIQGQGLGLDVPITFTTNDAIHVCTDGACSGQGVRDPEDVGTEHQLSLFNFGVPFRVKQSIALGSGSFYTNPFGTALRVATDADAVEQYIKPGLDLAVSQDLYNGRCHDIEGWHAALVCGQQALDFGGSNMREGSQHNPDNTIRAN